MPPNFPHVQEKPQLNYLTEYYADSLFTKEARVLADKLTEVLKRTNQARMVQEDSLELKSISRENLSAEEFHKTLQLEDIYGTKKNILSLRNAVISSIIFS